MPLPATTKLTPAQIADLESEDSLLRGSQGLAIFNEAIKETGVVIPPDYVFKDMDRGIIKKVHDSVFGLLGGVPAMLVWASQNPGDFYKQYAKFGASDNAMVNTGTVNIVSSLPPSPLDNRSIDSRGFVSVDADVADDDSDA